MVRADICIHTLHKLMYSYIYVRTCIRQTSTRNRVGEGHACPYIVRECMHLYSLLFFGRKRGHETLSTRGFRPLNPQPVKSYTDHQ